METNNETVADIVKELRDDADAVFSDEHDGEYWTNIEAGEIYYSIANRIEAAYRREINDMRFDLMTAKSEQKTAANVIIEQTNKVEMLECKVDDLLLRLKIAEYAMNFLDAEVLTVVNDIIAEALTAIREKESQSE